MSRARLKILSIGLVSCILLVSAVLYTQVAQHTMHHAHHKAATHGSPLCAWMCAAGEIHQGFILDPTQTLILLGAADSLTPTTAPIALPLEHSSRGPPNPLA